LIDKAFLKKIVKLWLEKITKADDKRIIV